MRDTALISVIVTTYNREDALDAALRALAHQSDRNFEIIIADDGSRPDTARVVESWQARLPLPLKHVRHEHRGFRGGEIRNRGIRASAGEICIFLDGDCLAPADFIAAHRRLAEPGWFVTGNRILLSPRTDRHGARRRCRGGAMEFGCAIAAAAARRHQSALPDAAAAARAVAQAEQRKLGRRANLQSRGGAARPRSHRRLRLRLHRLGPGGFRSRGASPACRRAAQGRPVRDRRVAFVASAERPLAVPCEPGKARRGHRRQSHARLARAVHAERRQRAPVRGNASVAQQ